MSADFGREALCSAVSVRNAAVTMKLDECLAPLSQDVWTIVNRCGSSTICPLISEDNISVNEKPDITQVTPTPGKSINIETGTQTPDLPARSEHELKGNREETPHQDPSGPISGHVGLKFWWVLHVNVSNPN